MDATFRLPLGDLNIITGPNFSGKSRVRRAVELALLGYSPALDKKPQAIIKLASGSMMEAEASFDDGQSIHRSWWRKGGTVSASHHVPKGLDGAMPLVMMDAGDYFSRSARGRVELVFASAKVTGGNVPWLNKALLEYGMMVSNVEGEPVQEFIERAFEVAERMRSEAAANVRRYGGTIQGLSALQLDDKAPQRSLEAIDDEIEEAQRGIGRLQSKKAEADEAQRAEETNALERERLAHKIAQAGDPMPREFNIEELRRREGNLSRDIQRQEQLRLKHDLWMDAQSKRERDIEIARAKRNAALQSTVDRTPPEADVCEECGRPYGQTESDIALIIANRERNRLFDIDHATKELDELVAAEIAPEPTPPSNMLVAEAELAAVQSSIDEYTRTADVQVWRKQLAALASSKPERPPSVIAEEIRINTVIIGRLHEERRLAESDRNDRKRLAEARREHEKALQDEERYKAAKKFLLEKKEELIGQVFGPLLETANALTEDILPYRIEYRDGEFGYFTSKVMEWEQKDKNKRGTLVQNYKMEIPHHWVSEETFSGTEQALLYAGLQAALGAQSPVRLVIVDELARMDEKVFLLFLINVARAQEAGQFTQFLGLTPRISHLDQLKGIGFTITEARGNNYGTI